MEKQVYQQIFDVEKTHWWFIGRRKIIARTIKNNVKSKVARALDIGSGTGLNSVILKEVATNVSAMDPSEEAVRLSKLRAPELQVLQGSFPYVELSERYSLITMFDVLEHIEPDVKSLKKVESLLEPGGMAVITVPAFPFLWSDHDRVLHHFRRYTKKSLVDVVKNNTGLSIVSIEYFNSFLFIPIAFFRALRKLFHILPDRADDFMVSPGLNSLLLSVFSFEGWLMQKLKYPFGISIICVLQKKP